MPEWSPKTIDELLESSDITLFIAAPINPYHVIHPLLPPPKPENAVTVSSYPTPNLTSARILYIVCYLKTFTSYYMFYYTLHVVEPRDGLEAVLSRQRQRSRQKARGRGEAERNRCCLCHYDIMHNAHVVISLRVLALWSMTFINEKHYREVS